MTSKRYGPLFAGIVALPLIAPALCTAGSQEAVRNVSVVEQCEFDTATHHFDVSWRLDTTEVPVGCEGAFIALYGNETPPDEPTSSFPVDALDGDSLVTFKSIKFDTTCRIGLMLRIQGTWIAPESTSYGEVRVPPSRWETVRFTASTLEDTVKFFGGSVLVWRDAASGNVTLYEDTVERYDPPSRKIKGFAKSGTGFRFRIPSTAPFLRIGMRLDSAALHGHAWIYRDSAGYIIAQHDARIDTVPGIISVATDRFDLPFMLLRDTLAPSVVFSSDTGLVLDGKSIELDFTVRDNCANCRWSLFAAGGDLRPFANTAAFSGTLDDTTQDVYATISPSGSLQGGFRITLVLRDGGAGNIVNVSRQSKLPRCGQMTTPANVITPMAPSAQLDSAACRSALRTLFTSAGGGYDKKVFRLYRWDPSGASSNGGGWLEYASQKAGSFAFTPGRLFWCITKNDVLLDFGPGRSTSLKDTLKIKLAASSWTDFANPYGFDLSLREITDASGKRAESLHFYKWSKDASRRTWLAAPLYCGAVPGLDSATTRLSSATGGYCTVYNPSDTEMTLLVPAVPALENGEETVTFLARRSVKNGADNWCVGFDLYADGSTLSTAIIASSAQSETTILYPAAPSFGGPSITVRYADSEMNAGSVVMPGTKAKNAGWKLLIDNPAATNAVFTCKARRISGNISGTAALESQTRRDLFDPVTVTVEPRSVAAILCKTGGEIISGEAADNAPVFTQPQLMSISSIGTDGTVAIKINGSGTDNLVEIFDMAGRRRAVGRFGGVTAGMVGTVNLRGVTAGSYIVRLTSIDGTRIVHQSTRHFIPLR